MVAILPLGAALSQAHRPGALNAGFLLPPHAVQFYEDEDSLLEALDDFVWDGLDVGDGVVAVARPPILAQLEQRLSGARAEMEAARARGQYVTLDADEVLEQILRDGRPDEALFQEVVGGLVTRVKTRFPCVRLFGEMVAILWEQGKAGEAIQLEALWNGLVKREHITLRCAYPLRLFDRAMHARPFATICDQHPHVLPAESYPLTGEPEQQLKVIAQLQQKARALEGEVRIRRQAEEALARQAARMESAKAEVGQILDAMRTAEGSGTLEASARRLEALLTDLLAPR
jgi:hypothetical protein